jgi:hypothetical protein
MCVRLSRIGIPGQSPQARGSPEDRVGAGVPLDDELVEAVGLVLGDVDPDALVVAVEWRALAAAVLLDRLLTEDPRVEFGQSPSDSPCVSNCR